MKKHTKSEAPRLPTYPSMAACAAATRIPVAVLRRAKRAGCPAFDQANRVHLCLLLEWLFAADRDVLTNTDWHQRFKRAQALSTEAELARRKGELIERAWVAERIMRAAGDLNAFRVKSELEHPTRFASAAGDPAVCRSIVRGIWDEIFRGYQSLSKHFEEDSVE